MLLKLGASYTFSFTQMHFSKLAESGSELSLLPLHFHGSQQRFLWHINLCTNLETHSSCCLINLLSTPTPIHFQFPSNLFSLCSKPCQFFYRGTEKGTSNCLRSVGRNRIHLTSAFPTALLSWRRPKQNHTHKKRFLYFLLVLGKSKHKVSVSPAQSSGISLLKAAKGRGWTLPQGLSYRSGLLHQGWILASSHASHLTFYRKALGKEKKNAIPTTPGPWSKVLPAQQNSSLPPAGRQLGLCHIQAFERRKKWFTAWQ